MKFESVIFQFYKTPNGRIAMLDKDKQHTYLKGMSPDLFDNVIMLCGGSYYDCYRILSTDAGAMRKTMQASEMLSMLTAGTDETPTQPYMRRRIRHSNEILDLLSSI